MTRFEVEEFLYCEAQLLDDVKLKEWSELFTADGIYWIPLDETQPISTCASIVYDTPLRREERVHHLLNHKFPAQSPRSRTVHMITNVRLVESEGGELTVQSNQTIYEMRTGDFRQVGIGEIQPLVARIEHLLRPDSDGYRIAQKKILLINRDTWQSNLTFII